MIKRALVPLDTTEATEDILPIVPGCTVPSITSFVRFGDTTAEILAEAAPFSADTIVVTTGTRSSVKRALLGSVAEAMLRRARVGVLLCRSPREH